MKKAYIVLGVPHSATSFISKNLEKKGVKMHSDLRKYYEDSDFVKLNTEILKQARGSISFPPKEEKILNLDFNKQIKQLINKKRKKVWGWKDPRTSLTIQKYLPYLDEDVCLICVFRKPQHIKNSFKKDNKTIKDKSIKSINKAILNAIKNFCEL